MGWEWWAWGKKRLSEGKDVGGKGGTKRGKRVGGQGRRSRGKQGPPGFRLAGR